MPIPLGKKAAKALDVYLFARAKHPHADSPYLWLGKRGRVTASGLYQLIERRCEEAGIERIHPHQLHHTWAHKLQEGNINDSDHMYLADWRTRTMLNGYGASAAAVLEWPRLSEFDRALDPEGLRDAFSAREREPWGAEAWEHLVTHLAWSRAARLFCNIPRCRGLLGVAVRPIPGGEVELHLPEGYAFQGRAGRGTLYAPSKRPSFGGALVGRRPRRVLLDPLEGTIAVTHEQARRVIVLDDRAVIIRCPECRNPSALVAGSRFP